jgi:hypothetical protein
MWMARSVTRRAALSKQHWGFSTGDSVTFSIGKDKQQHATTRIRCVTKASPEKRLRKTVLSQ